MHPPNEPSQPAYRGRLAPSPTGYLHLGHARTFWRAQQQALAHRGILVLRNEDLDASRTRPEFVAAMLEDLRWFGLSWSEGPDIGGPAGPYTQSERRHHYARTFQRLQECGALYPCRCSRRDVERALGAPHAGDEEPIYPGTCRHGFAARADASSKTIDRVCWRFRVPDGEAISFTDSEAGEQSFVAGRDFGDFVVWRPDDVPAYQLAVVTDDNAMGITEVVRGQDLLLSTARQILIYRALGLPAPEFHHCPLMLDENGVRLAKRHDALSLRALRDRGLTPAQVRSLPGFVR